MTGLASNAGASVNVVLPELGNPVLGGEVTRKALSSWKLMSMGIGWQIISPGIGWNILSPGTRAQR